ncbi:MAG: aminotransferase class IV [Rhodospirillaceae bacterium]|nr:aminotransferase class IV [Rhodospirillaceae bacterium]
MTRRNERMAYFNGRIVPESQVLIPFRDRGFLYGDAVFDTTRTFNHKPFRLKEHVERLYRSLSYLRIDPGLKPEALIAITEEVLALNLPLLDPDEDTWVTQRISRGLRAGAGEARAEPTVIVETWPLPLAERASLFRDGIAVVVPPTRRTPPDMLSPRAKTHNYLNLIVGDLEAKSVDPLAWAVLLDADGHLSEGIGSNIFLVRAGRLLTPQARHVLPGISRLTVIELAEKLAIPVAETGLDLYDAYTADEAFLTSTSLCICPVRSINGHLLGDGGIPGPVTRRLTEAYIELVGCDFVGQHLRRLAA